MVAEGKNKSVRFRKIRQVWWSLCGVLSNLYEVVIALLWSLKKNGGVGFMSQACDLG